MIRALLRYASVAAAAVALSAAAVRAQNVQMPQAEYNAYNNAMQQTDPATKAAALEDYLTGFPQSQVKASVLETLIPLYASVNNQARALDTSDRLLEVDPGNLRALFYEAFLRKSAADPITDPAAKQTALDAAAAYARRGLSAAKPEGMQDADFQTLKTVAYPYFYSAIGIDAFARKEDAAAIDAYRSELAIVPLEVTEKAGPTLQDTYYLAASYQQSSTPDLFRCAFYAARAAVYAPEPFKSQMLPLAKYCYRKYHGGDDGYDGLVATATANLNPPPGFYVKPAPGAAEIVRQVIDSTPDLAALALSDKEFILQKGSAEDAQKVWATMKDRTVEIPGAVVVYSAPGYLRLAVSGDAIQARAADFTFRFNPPLPDLPAEGSKVTVQGTYDLFSASGAGLMLFMRDSAIVTPGSRHSHGYGAAQAPVPHAAPATVASRDLPTPAASPTRAFDTEPSAQSSPPVASIPHNYALIFATDHYTSWPELENPIFDADALAQTLQSLYGFQVEEAKDQTNAQIIEKLTEYLHRRFQPQDQLLIFFSGHGYFDPDLGQGFIVPANAARPQDDPGHLTLVAHDTIMRYVDSIPSQHVVLILDACFAGTLDRKIAESGLRGDPSMDIYTHATLSELLARKEPKRTRRYFASGGKDFVPDGLPGHHSPFMSALLVTLNQAADRKGYATLDDLQQGLETVKPEPRWGDIQDNNDPGADFLLLTPSAVAQAAKGN